MNNPCSNHLVHLNLFKIRVSLDDKIIVVFTLKYFYHFTFTIALCSVFNVHLFTFSFREYVLKFVSLLLLFSEQKKKYQIFGGPKWTRTTDLTLIRRAL